MQTMPSQLASVAQNHGQLPALVHRSENLRLSYAELAARVELCAAGLHASGIEPGDRVALWGPNHSTWVVAQWALASLGAVWVPVDPGAGPEDLSFLLDHCGAKGVLLFEDLLPGLRAALAKGIDPPELVAAWPGGGQGALGWEELMARGEAAGPDAVRELGARVRPEQACAIMYTSGTTGAPKGVMVDHGSLVAKSLASAQRQGIGPGDALALFFPLFHMFGNTCIGLAGVLAGATLVVPGPAFEPGQVLAALSEEGCTAVYGAPSMMAALMDHPDFSPGGLPRLRTGIIGGAPCPMELMKRITGDLGAGQALVGYGITEASSWVTMTLPDDPLDLRVSTIGRPLPGCEVKISDPRSDSPLPAGEGGEICTRGHLMMGYYRAEQLTAQAIDREGWFHTGDMGVMDQHGYVRITGRLKEVISRGGREIFPAQVEEAAYGLEAVAEAAAFGVPAPGGGEELALWVRPRPGRELTAEAVLAHLRQALDPGLVPDQVRLVESFPCTRSGKVQKFRLTEMALELRGGEDQPAR